MAPGVIMESYGFEQEGGLQQGFLYTDPGDIEDDYSEAISVHGAHISNNSIGTNTAPNGYPCEWEGNYGATGVLIDTIVRGDGSNPLFSSPFRVVWANGNERNSGRCGTTYHTTAPPACAKNHITVGAINSNDDSVTDFTSWGPTDDNRLKPDISAPGCQTSDDYDVTSCSSSGGYTGKCGTSMASPTVCGLGALLLQDFRAHYPGEPDFRNSTLKVFLAHTAVDIAEPGPDYKSGYGSVRIQPAVDLMRSGNFLENQIGQGDIYTVAVIVAPGDDQLKVTLAWDDVPGTANVSPVLVNDLDLRVFDSTDTEYFPWTLGGLADPSAPAVRTQADHVNNIEQVVIDSPTPGAYRVEIYGYNVPQGPQPFSLTATPYLVNCSSQGTATLNRPKYPCAETATLQVVDCDLNTSDSVIDTVDVLIASTSEPTGEVVTLTETAAESAAFLADIELSTTDAVGVLWIASGDVITLTYNDADDGTGQPAVVTDTAVVDCQGPIISYIHVDEVNPRDATISFHTDEPAQATIHYGLACGSLNESQSVSGYRTSHTITLTGLQDGLTYYFAVEAIDEAGNSATDNHGGDCYQFTTLEIPDFYTELFDASDNDIDNIRLKFTPNGSNDFYAGCTEEIDALPTDPSTGTGMTFTPNDDDGYAQLSLTGGATISLYGQSYSTFYVGTNGYITFDHGETSTSESFSNHFATPQISAMYDDLDPGAGGTISWEQFADRVVVTYLNVAEYSSGVPNTFQIEIYFDGTISLNYLTVSITDGLVGLSDGGGVDPDFMESDLSTMLACGEYPPIAYDSQATVDGGVATLIALQADDDGFPNPPGMLSYIITALPQNGALSDPGAGQITSVPYTLSGGTQVQYYSSPYYVGPDSFQFKVNDGGVPDDGGDSNVATVSVTVSAARRVIHSFPLDSDPGWSTTGSVGVRPADRRRNAPRRSVRGLHGRQRVRLQPGR